MKLIVEEDGSALAARLWNDADSVAINRIGYTEARAALAAGRRTGRLALADFRRSKRVLDKRWAELRVVELTERLASIAGDVAERRALRAYDAVHLASAVIARVDVVATWDVQLAGAAETEGLAVAP